MFSVIRSLTLLLLLISCAAYGQTFEHYGRQASKAYTAFECSRYAYVMNDLNESDRLFHVGYSNGMSFAKAYENYEVDTISATKHMPNLIWALDFPPYKVVPGFIVGRIYDIANNEALKNIEPNKTKGIAKRARSWFSKANCKSIK